jgi:eukaryotic-like serine/threonine-protein kinase
VLLMLVEQAGGVVTREEIKRKLWPNDTVVEFDHGTNTAIRYLRQILHDSAQTPRYIETVARRGYRLMVAVTPVLAEDSSGEQSSAESASHEVSFRAAPERSRGGVEGSPVDDSEALPKAKLKVGALTGSVVSHYRVLEVIGGGGMGLVYRAEDLKLGRAVALKFLPEDLGDDPRARERFRREAKAVSALDHPNICAVHEFDEYEGHPFLVMQLLQGKTLRDHLVEGRFRLTQPEGLEVAIQIASGLEAAHEKGIIHRDIKPANIFITEKNVAKILDFGVAKVLENPHPANTRPNGAPDNDPSNGVILSEDAEQHEEDESKDPHSKEDVGGIGVSRFAGSLDGMTNENGAENGTAEAVPLQSHAPLTHTGMKLGTAGYMSPEQIRGEPLDARTDIFSFGLVLYEMATGERAFTGETEASLHDAIENREPKPVRELAPEISPTVERVIETCLQKKPAKRFQTAAGIKSAVVSADNQTVSWEAQQTKQPETPHLGRWLVAALALLLLVGLTGAVVYRRAHPYIQLTDKDTIVLADFENKTGDPVFDGSLTEALRVALEQTPFINLLAADKVNRVGKEIGLSGERPLTSEGARQVCLKTNSAALVTGSISDAGNGYQIVVRALRCNTGAVIVSANREAERRNEIVRELGLAAVSVRKKLGEPSRTLREFNQPLETATTPSVEALNWFTTGKRVRAHKSDREAIPFFSRAVEADPYFADAYSRLGSALRNDNRPDSAREMVQKAYALRGRVTTRQSLKLTGKYLELCTGDMEAATRQWAEMARIYPNSAVPHAELAWTLLMLGKYADAAVEAREAIRLDPDDSPPYTNLTFIEIAMNRPDEAKAALKEAQSRHIVASIMPRLRYWVAFLERDGEAMQQQLDWAANTSESTGLLSQEQAGTESYFGRLKRSRQFLAHAVGVSNHSGLAEVAAKYKAEQAVTEAEVGNLRQARQYASEAATLDSSAENRAEIALALARAGDLGARDLAVQLSGEMTNDKEFREYTLACVQAAIALQRSEPAEAASLVNAASLYELRPSPDPGSLYSAYLRGLAYLSAHRGQEAAAEFQKIIDHPGIALNNVWSSLAHLQLARAQVMMGDTQAVPGLSHSLERCRSRHSYLQAGQGGVREAELARINRMPSATAAAGSPLPGAN